MALNPWREEMSSEFALSPASWAHLVEHHWEQKPLLIKQPFAGPLATAAELFQALVKAGDQFRAGDRSVTLRFYIEHALLQAEIGKHAPQSSDLSLKGYAQRLAPNLAGRGFALVLNDLQVYDARLWLRLREFLRGLYEFIGLPADTVAADVWLGNYDKTPAGVHQDRASNFMFVIEGHRRMHLWPDEFFREMKPTDYALDYEPYLDEAITLEGEPGDLAYWPSSYWHIGESVGGLSVTLNLALYLKFRPSVDVLSHATRMVREHLGPLDQAQTYPFARERFQENAGTLPEQIELATKVLRQVSRDARLVQAIRESWLNRITGSGFTELPPASPWRSLDDAQVVRGCADYPILWLPAADDEIICSANGHSFTIAAHPKILQLIERLNTGEACRVKSLIAEHAGSIRVDDTEFVAEAEEIRALLEKLYTWHAITDGH